MTDIERQLKSEEGRSAVLEFELQKRLGVPRHVLKKKRAEFTEGVDWQTISGAVVWSQEAAERMIASFAPPDAPQPPPPDAPQPAPEKTPRRLVLTVAFMPLPNRTLVAAVEAGADARDRSRWILIKVRDNRRFLPGMPLLAEEVPGVKLWRFLGPPDAAPGAPVRYPRFRGKWGLPGEKPTPQHTELT